jgi:hypothetical protein
MQDPTDNRDVDIAVSPDPLDQLVKRVRVGEDVVGGLPIGVLVGIAKARHSVGKRSSEVRRSGACEDCRLKSVNDIRRIIAEQLIVAGFATFPETLLELFAGENLGKLVLQADV